LLRTGPIDHGDWVYSPLLGAIIRRRFKLILKLLGNRKFDSLLEIGYGSGIIMPELAKHTRRLTGIDIHPHNREVADLLASRGTHADLHSASMTNIPFPGASFDCVVAVSAMEFVDDIDGACKEIRRVLKPGGEFLLVTPGKSALLDFGLWVLTREDAKRDFAGRRERLLPALERHFASALEIRSPRAGGKLLCLYRAFRLLKP
jgi:SAM-dependent methyltransferase